MAQIRNFRTTYNNVLPTDYLKVSDSSKTEDEKLSFLTLATEITKNKTLSNRIIISKNANSDFIAESVSGASKIGLFDGLTLFGSFSQLHYNYQDKLNPTIKVFDFDSIPLINGVYWDYFSKKNLDANTIANGVYSITYSIDAMAWKYYKLSGQPSFTQLYSLFNQQQAGIEILDGRIINENFPNLKFYFGSELPMLANTSIAGGGSETPALVVSEGQIENITGNFFGSVFSTVGSGALHVTVDEIKSREINLNLTTQFTKGIDFAASRVVNTGTKTLTKRYGMYPFISL